MSGFIVLHLWEDKSREYYVSVDAIESFALSDDKKYTMVFFRGYQSYSMCVIEEPKEILSLIKEAKCQSLYSIDDSIATHGAVVDPAIKRIES